MGRLHVFLGAAVTNCVRRAARDKSRGAARTISLKQSFCIWFSGLRGGVAFAIAAASYGDLDFPSQCGGWKPAQPAWCNLTPDSGQGWSPTARGALPLAHGGPLAPRAGLGPPGPSQCGLEPLRGAAQDASLAAFDRTGDPRRGLAPLVLRRHE